MGNLPLFDDRWILAQRRGVPRMDGAALPSPEPVRPYAYLVEPEYTAEGRVEDVATIFITNKECPFRCLMCDLWRNTTLARVQSGSVFAQVEWALRQLPPAAHLKLYNSGNFFDDQAISRGDRDRLVTLVAAHRTVIVECHPKLVSARCLEFARSINGALQVAMGLETVDPAVLPRLNKRMTLDDFARATERLVSRDIAVRAFILLRTPFQSEPEGVEWARRSIDFAFSIGVECCAVVPTRTGNGAMERLMEQGQFHPPTLRSMEAVLEYGLSLAQGRVFMDLWDIEKFHTCPRCSPQRAERLARMNLSQQVPAPIPCDCRLSIED